MDGWMDGWMDTPQTVTTTRAPAVLTIGSRSFCPAPPWEGFAIADAHPNPQIIEKYRKQWSGG